MMTPVINGQKIACQLMGNIRQSLILGNIQGVTKIQAEASRKYYMDKNINKIELQHKNSFL